MGEPLDILGIGTSAVDDLLDVPRYPPADEKAPILDRRRALGGQIATALAAAARLGARCAFAARLGSDELSQSVQAGLTQAGVMVRAVAHGGAGPIHSIIIVDRHSGGRTIFYDLKRLSHLAADEFEMVTRTSQPKVLLLDQFGGRSLLQAAQRPEAAIVMDLEWPDEPRLADMAAMADHLILSRGFAGNLTGLKDPAAIVRALAAAKQRACTAVTCGADGCWFATADDPQPRHIAAVPVKTLETTGCGDVFHGAYAAALARGETVEQCIRFASAAAAVYASRPTGWQHLPTAADVAIGGKTHH